MNGKHLDWCLWTIEEPFTMDLTFGGETYRQCHTCKELKSMASFRMRDSDLTAVLCSECREIALAKYRAQVQRASRRQHEQDKLNGKAQCRYQTLQAIKRGELVKPAVCSGCGAQATRPWGLQCHHRDYSNPLDVEWLCPGCHARADLQRRHVESQAA